MLPRTALLLPSLVVGQWHHPLYTPSQHPPLLYTPSQYPSLLYTPSQLSPLLHSQPHQPRPTLYHGGVQHTHHPWALGPLLEKLLKFTCPEVAAEPTKLEKGETAYPHPRDCSKYYICDKNGTAEEYDCLFRLTGLLFSDKTGSCEWASQVECFGLKLEDDLEAVEQEEEIEYICLWEGDFSDPEYCMRYYHCDKDLRASLQYCSTGNFFAPLDNEGSGSCQWAAAVYCEDRREVPPGINDIL